MFAKSTDEKIPALVRRGEGFFKISRTQIGRKNSDTSLITRGGCLQKEEMQNKLRYY